MTSLQRFVSKWCHPDYEPHQVSEEELANVERVFSIRFPTDYRDQIIAVGAPFPTLALLSAICDHEVDVHDLSSLCKPSEIVDETTGWREAGLPLDLLVIGGDGGGNSFCFKISELKRDSRSEAPIYFWDHDINETQKVAPNFSAWIDKYLGHWSDGLTYSDF